MSTWSIKRVPLNFDWPVGCVWHGYVNPWPGPVGCDACLGTGLNDASLKLYRNFKRWAPQMTDVELDLALKFGIVATDLSKIRRRTWNEIETNHNQLRSDLTEIRAKITKVWGACPACNGLRVVLNPNPAIQQLYADVNLYEEWRPIEPPKGEGWQLWRVKDPGKCPESAVYDSETSLAKWCALHFNSDYTSWFNWIMQENLKVSQESPSFKLKCENVVIYTQPISKA